METEDKIKEMAKHFGALDTMLDEKFTEEEALAFSMLCMQLFEKHASKIND